MTLRITREEALKDVDARRGGQKEIRVPGELGEDDVSPNECPNARTIETRRL